MTRSFERLYRIFLFRVVNLELISAGGDISRLIGQMAVVPVLLGVGFTLGAVGFGGPSTPHREILVAAWGLEHTLIATTMLLTGVFTVLSWESTFPDLSDVFVLGPLPLDARTIFFAKGVALAAAQGTVIVALNALPGLAWPLALAPPSRNLIDLILMPQVYRTLLCHWLTMFSAGGFVFFSVLAIQGVLAQLAPRRVYLRVSALLQILAFSLLLSVYFLQPSLSTPSALSAEENQRILRWLPSYWFLGLFQLLNGSMHPVMEPLAKRAMAGLFTAVIVATTTYLLTYRRRLRQIVEEPELVPGNGQWRWIPRLRYSLGNAVLAFAWRTVTRSRQHRMALAFYLGLGLSMVIFLLQTGVGKGHFSQQQEARIIFASAIIVTAWILGMRAVYTLPITLRANWIFRIAQTQAVGQYLAAARRTLLVMTLLPALVVALVTFLSIWPRVQALRHVTLLAFWALLVMYGSLKGFRKIPFTCSYQPGKSMLHMRVLAAIGVMILLGTAAAYEQRALSNNGSAPESDGVVD